MTNHYITWWNVENLFDVYNSDIRPEWLAKALKAELKGWTNSVLEKKINNLSSIIKQINNNMGPDLLGVCEVENENVVKKLISSLDIPGRKYKVLHHDTKDQRGIDIAFIYDSKKYIYDGLMFSYEVLKRSSTRDILQVNLKTKDGNDLIVIGNHWPSRSGGQYSSEPYRMMAGETLSYWMKRILEIKGSKASVFLMGDFNDEPFNRSLKEYALSTISRYKVVYGRNPYLYNLMWELVGKRIGSYVFNSEPLMIDQFLISKGIVLNNGKFSVEHDSVRTEIFDGMVKGRYDTPVRFGRPSGKKSYNPKGFSDHLPVSVNMVEG